MKKALVLIGLAVVAGAANAQVNYNWGNYTQNFDTLALSGTAIPWNDNTTLAGWYLRRINDPNVVLANQYEANTGSSNAGAAYSYGSVDSTDRALGSVASGSVEHLAYGVRLRNNTGVTLNQFTLTYTGEQWRNGGNASAQKLTFSYNIGGSTIGNDQQATGGTVGYVADPNFTTFSGLDFTSPTVGTTASALDGNAAANRTLITNTVTGINWGAGQDLWIRWVDLNDVGNDHGLALDDMTFSAVPEPATMAVLGLGAAALLRRRRK